METVPSLALKVGTASGKFCLVCDEPLLSSAINIQEGVALCPRCGRLSKLSELIESNRSKKEQLENPPSGCAIESWGNQVTLVVSTRSMAGIVGSGLVCLFWNGLLSIFLLHALAGVYFNLYGPLPAWFPVIEKIPKVNDKPMDWGATLFLCFFLTPFVLVGMGMLWWWLLCAIGKLEVQIDEMDSYVALRVGPVVWRRRFNAKQVSAIESGLSSYQKNGEHQPLIRIAADRTVNFGTMLPHERLEWLRLSLREILLPPPEQYSSNALPKLSWIEPRN